MSWVFGDSFDCYAAPGDAVLGYWDSGSGLGNLGAGRFAGSQSLRSPTSTAGIVLTKASSGNDSVHHVVLAFDQTTTLTGINNGFYLQFLDGTTAQCTVAFRSDGAMLLQSGIVTGTTLATYTGAVTAANTWVAFEIEVVISSTVGSISVRKNGNTVNDFFLGSLNTRGGTTNNYANKLSIGHGSTAVAWLADDILWRSDAASVPWVGDIRAYTRMPASDASVQFSRAPSPVSVTPFAQSSSIAVASGTVTYIPFTASFSGTVATTTVSVNAGVTAHVKAAIYDGAHGSVLATSNEITNPTTGINTLTFASPPTLTKGTSYYFAINQDASVTYNAGGLSGTVLTGTTTYASFPATSPPSLTGSKQPPTIVIAITPTVSSEFVNETLQDGTTSYVYDSNVGDQDFYNIAALAGTPASTVCVTTRGFLQKSDAGTRNAQVQLKSGGATVNTGSVALSTSWGWMWRTDTTDPGTSAAWTATGVNNVQIGAAVTA